MRLEWKCPCDRAFGTTHVRDFAVEGLLQRTEKGVTVQYDVYSFSKWLVTTGPATTLKINGKLVWEDGKWLDPDVQALIISQ
jgi:hypothetical protein